MTIGAYEAKTHLPALLDKVAKGEQITITKHGVPVAVLMPVSAEETRDVGKVIEAIETFGAEHRLEKGNVRDLIEEGRRQ